MLSPILSSDSTSDPLSSDSTKQGAAAGHNQLPHDHRTDGAGPTDMGCISGKNSYRTYLEHCNLTKDYDR